MTLAGGARSLFLMVCRKRKQMMQKLMQFLLASLRASCQQLSELERTHAATNPAANAAGSGQSWTSDPAARQIFRSKDAVLQLFYAAADVLIKACPNPTCEHTNVVYTVVQVD